MKICTKKRRAKHTFLLENTHLLLTSRDSCGLTSLKIDVRLNLSKHFGHVWHVRWDIQSPRQTEFALSLSLKGGVTNETSVIRRSYSRSQLNIVANIAISTTCGTNYRSIVSNQRERVQLCHYETVSDSFARSLPPQQVIIVVIPCRRFMTISDQTFTSHVFLTFSCATWHTSYILFF